MNFILISEAAKITGLYRQTIKNWIDKGIIPAQKINGTLYVDKDTFETLAEKMQDVDGAMKRLDALKERYSREIDMYQSMRNSAHSEHNTIRYLSVCINSGIRMRFFDNIVHIMQNNGLLSEREAHALSEIINGKDMDDVARDYGTTRERIRQIAEKAIRKSRELVITKDDTAKNEEIKAMKEEIAVLKRMVYREAIRVTEEGLTDTEKKLARMDRLELMALLSKPLDDVNFSVRTQNAIRYCLRGGIKTLGDLCRVSRDFFMKQRNVGKKTVIELDDYLKDNGLTWDMDIDRILGLI